MFEGGHQNGVGHLAPKESQWGETLVKRSPDLRNLTNDHTE